MRLGIIGGGPAGIFAAIAAAETSGTVDGRGLLSVVVLEATDRLLEKVRISGGGRCNVTHHCFDAAELVRNYPRGHRELLGPFHRFQPQDTVSWFERHGVLLKTEPDGRMFPVTDSSQTIIDCLVAAARRGRIDVRMHRRVKSLRRTANTGKAGVAVELADGTLEVFDRVLLATGSSPQGYRLAAGIGHTIVPPVPSLFTFKISDPRLTDLAGISFDRVGLSLSIGEARPFHQDGPMLVTHWGLSGPAVLKLSAWAARELHDHSYHSELRVNFAPQFTSEQAFLALGSWKQNHARMHVGTDNPFGLPRRYWERAALAAGVHSDRLWADMSKAAMTELTAQVAAARFTVRGKGVFKDEFVTCGGIDLREIDFRTMQSRIAPGLYFAGEILDIDGVTGGFNFQNAWTTGWIAGTSMADASAG